MYTNIKVEKDRENLPAYPASISKSWLNPDRISGRDRTNILGEDNILNKNIDIGFFY